MRRHLGIAIAGAALLGACVEEVEPVDTDPRIIEQNPSFEEHIEPMLATCVACHQGAAPDGGFDMTGELYDKLVGVNSVQAESLAFVEPGDSRQSYLWHKINGSQSLAGGAGTRMPLGDPWPEEDVALLALWIDLGAEP